MLLNEGCLSVRNWTFPPWRYGRLSGGDETGLRRWRSTALTQQSLAWARLDPRPKKKPVMQQIWLQPKRLWLKKGNKYKTKCKKILCDILHTLTNKKKKKEEERNPKDGIARKRMPDSRRLSQSYCCSVIRTEWMYIKIKGVNVQTCRHSAWLRTYKPNRLQGGILA